MLSGFALLLFAVVFSGTALTAPQSPPADYVAVYVADMHCAHCAKKVSSKLYTVKGVIKVRTDLKKHLAVVVPAPGKKLSPRVLWEAIEAVKLKPVKIVTAKQTFTKKPPKQVNRRTSLVPIKEAKR
jgi:copper chaperone CopZ